MPADGVVATKDRSALLASILAERRGLQALPAGPVRLPAQADVAADPRARRARGDAALGVLGAEPPPFGRPGSSSRSSAGSRRTRGASTTRRASTAPPVGTTTAPGTRRSATPAGLDGDAVRGYLAEEVRSGQEVTLEGFSHRGRVTTIGVTDSIKYPGTNSFERFEYPSRLPSERLAELAARSRRVVPALGFDDGFFNVEFFVPDEGRGRSSR